MPPQQPGTKPKKSLRLETAPKNLRRIIYDRVGRGFDAYREQHYPGIRAWISRKDINNKCNAAMASTARKNGRDGDLTNHSYLHGLIFAITRSLLKDKNVPVDDDLLKQVFANLPQKSGG